MNALDREADGDDNEDVLVLEQHFAIVPEWVLDADISDASLRLYAVLLRYGQTSGNRMPGRRLLAGRLHKRSRDSVDRALKELVGIGAVVVQHRRQGAVNLTNRYVVRSTPPRRAPVLSAAEERDTAVRGGISAAGNASGTAVAGGGRRFAATPGRTDAATVAADMRPNPEVLTQRTPPPPSPSPALPAPPGGGARGRPGRSTRPSPRGSRLSRGADRRTRLLEEVGVDSLDAVAAHCRATRRSLGLPVGRWTARVLADVLVDAVLERGWPAEAALPALLAVASDRDTRSPARLSCAGPWWDAAELSGPPAGQGNRACTELAELEAVLAEADGHRVLLQRMAREQLAAERLPVTRLNVARRAVALLHGSGGTASEMAHAAASAESAC